MRVCLYSETALPMVGGQELALDSLARQFLKLGHEPHLLTLQQRRRAVADDSVFPYRVTRHRRYFSTRYFLDWFQRALSTVYREFPFDVLHCHNIYPAGYIGARWCERYHVPLVVTSHGCDIAPDSHLLRKPQVARRVNFVLSQAQAAIAINEPLARQFAALGSEPRSIVRIPNGVDFVAPVARPTSLSPRIQTNRYFLFLGRLVRRKGVDVLLQAFRDLATCDDVRLVVAGTGEEEPALRQLACELDVSERTDFVGVVAGDMKAFLLQNALAVVMPSRISEGASLVLLEAFAAGKPVIGAAVPGLTEAICDAETGRLFTAESPAALRDTMRTLVENPDNTARMGAAAKQVAADFDWCRIAQRHLVVYRKAIASRKAIFDKRAA